MKTNEIQFGGKSYVCRIVEANDGEEPVSYTHLDVYKRQ